MFRRHAARFDPSNSVVTETTLPWLLCVQRLRLARQASQAQSCQICLPHCFLRQCCLSCFNRLLLLVQLLHPGSQDHVRLLAHGRVLSTLLFVVSTWSFPCLDTVSLCSGSGTGATFVLFRSSPQVVCLDSCQLGLTLLHLRVQIRRHHLFDLSCLRQRQHCLLQRRDWCKHVEEHNDRHNSQTCQICFHRETCPGQVVHV